MKKKLYVVNQHAFWRRDIEAYKLEKKYNVIGGCYESFGGLKELISEKIKGQFIAVSDELLCRQCWGDHWIEEATKNILLLSKQNRISFYSEGASIIPKRIREQLKAAGIKYLNGVEIE